MSILTLTPDTRRYLSRTSADWADDTSGLAFPDDLPTDRTIMLTPAQGDALRRLLTPPSWTTVES